VHFRVAAAFSELRGLRTRPASMNTKATTNIAALQVTSPLLVHIPTACVQVSGTISAKEYETAASVKSIAPITDPVRMILFMAISPGWKTQ
jgi:hypothetical protein